MTTQPQPLPIPAAPRHTGRRRTTALVGAAAILVLAVSIGLWQADRLRTTDSDSSPLTATTAPPVTSQAAETVPTIYLVGSQAQAEALHADLEEANAVLATSGEPPLAQQVVWFDSAEAEARFWRVTGAGDDVRDRLGLPPVSVIDLRGLSVASTAASTSGAAPTFLYLVDSSEERAFIQELTGSLDQLRHERNEQPVRTAVLVGSTLDRAALEQLPGTPGTLIVDLRAPVPTATATDAPARELEALTAASLGVPLAP